MNSQELSSPPLASQVEILAKINGYTSSAVFKNAKAYQKASHTLSDLKERRNTTNTPLESQILEVEITIAETQFNQAGNIITATAKKIGCDVNELYEACKSQGFQRKGAEAISAPVNCVRPIKSIRSQAQENLIPNNQDTGISVERKDGIRSGGYRTSTKPEALKNPGQYNEDALMIIDNNGSGFFSESTLGAICVADGVSTSKKGLEHSRDAIKAFESAFNGCNVHSTDAVNNRISRFVELSENMTETTKSFVVPYEEVNGEKLIAVHTNGDSPVFVVDKDGKITKKTSDGHPLWEGVQDYTVDNKGNKSKGSNPELYMYCAEIQRRVIDMKITDQLIQEKDSLSEQYNRDPANTDYKRLQSLASRLAAINKNSTIESIIDSVFGNNPKEREELRKIMSRSAFKYKGTKLSDSSKPFSFDSSFTLEDYVRMYSDSSQIISESYSTKFHPFEEGSTVVVASDGITDNLTSIEILRIVQNGKNKGYTEVEIAKLLAQSAQESNIKPDDMSVACMSR